MYTTGSLVFFFFLFSFFVFSFFCLFSSFTLQRVQLFGVIVLSPLAVFMHSLSVKIRTEI